MASFAGSKKTYAAASAASVLLFLLVQSAWPDVPEAIKPAESVDTMTIRSSQKMRFRTASGSQYESSTVVEHRTITTR